MSSPLHFSESVWANWTPLFGEQDVDLVRPGLDQGVQEVGCDLARCLPVQLGERELAGAVDGDEQVQLALLGKDLGDVVVACTAYEQSSRGQQHVPPKGDDHAFLLDGEHG